MCNNVQLIPYKVFFIFASLFLQKLNNDYIEPAAQAECKVIEAIYKTHQRLLSLLSHTVLLHPSL